MVIEEHNPGVTFAKGFTASGVKAGIKKSGKEDLAIIYTEKKANVAGVFTQNLVAAAPVFVSKAVAAKGMAHAVVVNAGCANACTGGQGMKDAQKTVELAAEALNISADEIFVASTGVIGQTLPMDKMAAGIKDAVAKLSPTGSEMAGKAILTTDLYSKAKSMTITLGGKEVRLGGIAKGSGMIHPNMATMLGFITTDAAVDSKLLHKALTDSIAVSFNMITVDGDTSTNDMVLVMANGAAGNAMITEENDDYKIFAAALKELCTDIAKQIAHDGEGASKFLAVNVKGAKCFADAKTIGMAVAKSPLVKTAFFGEDPNWGRVICAVGYAGIPMTPEKTVVSIGDIVVYRNGLGAEYDDAKLKDVMHQHDIEINIELNDGDVDATVWTCDFTYEYVKINGEYHT